MNKKPYCNNLLNQIDAVLYQPCVLKTYSKVVFSTAEKLYGETLEHQIQIIDFFHITPTKALEKLVLQLHN